MDWRNLEDYAYTDDIKLHDWAWEFLRRNEHFQAASRKYWDGELDMIHAFYRFLLKKPSDASLRAGHTKIFWLQYAGMHLLDDYLPPEEKPRFPLPGVSLFFDLTTPLEPQITLAKAYLEGKKRGYDSLMGVKTHPRPRPQVDKFKGYIRALDGKAAGATQEEIGSALFPEDSNPRETARYALKKGKEMANRGYVDLLLMENR